jgi:acetyltransferase-like isoleucine patch superfamily enzyme
VIILPGITIEEGAVIGAGTLVNKNVPKGAVVVGNPFQIIKYRNLEKYEQLKLQGKIYLREKLMGNIKIKVDQQ